MTVKTSAKIGVIRTFVCKPAIDRNQIRIINCHWRIINVRIDTDGGRMSGRLFNWDDTRVSNLSLLACRWYDDKSMKLNIL